MAFSGSVKMPNPFGALNPRLCLIIRFMEVRAAILFVKEGIRNPNFIGWYYFFSNF
jgi:hypothetical protein